MEIAPLLFDLGTSKPTSRQVADLVKAGGADALTEAIRRADAARYQEIRCRSALNSVKGMPFDWTLNPYRGCTHGCHYCYARRYHTQFELGADDEFASIIFVKTNFVQVLRRELQRPCVEQRATSRFGTATDCYQPIEGLYKLTRGVARSVLRLQHTDRRRDEGTDGRARQGRARRSLARRPTCTVCISVPCVDEDVWRALEPGTAPPLQRLRAVKELVDSGIQSRRPDEPDRPGHLVEAGAARAHGEGDRGPRRALRRLQRDVPARRARATTSCAGLARNTRTSSTATSGSTPASTRPRAISDEVKNVVGLMKQKYERQYGSTAACRADASASCLLTSVQTAIA